MDTSLEMIASSLEALQQQYYAIAHNLANVDTTGYKRQMTTFAEELAQKMGPAAQEPAGTSTEVVGTIEIDFSQGALVQTGSKLDLGLQGKGFFVIETPEGPLYTRNGAFQLNPQRQLVDCSGRIVAGEGGPITVPPEASTLEIHVSPDGRVSAGGSEIGKLRIVEFSDTSLLIPVGNGCFKGPQGLVPAPGTATTVQQGYQEGSNVNIVTELVGLISVARLYEANIKSMTTQDERMKTILEVAMS